MAYEEITWRCDGRDLSIGLECLGQGPTLLMLPALSSISTRREMFPLQERLSRSYTAISVDWPGFGDQPKPFIDWRPEIYQSYLSHLLERVTPQPFAILAAGHAAGYVLRHFRAHGPSSGRVVLLSPTWRGPLPTLLGGDRPIFARMARAFDPPLLGAGLYRLNVNRVVVGMMARGHVYADPAWLSKRRLQDKLSVVRAAGARHASARFVTGRLDPFRSRKEQLEAARRLAAPTLNVFSENAPTKSRAEMEALAALPNVTTRRLPQGKLSFYEEFPEPTAGAIVEFLARH